MTTPRIAAVLAALFLLAGCSKPPPIPEEKAVRDSFDAHLLVSDPDINVLLVHAAWLGPEALPILVKELKRTDKADNKRFTLTRVLEIMAWNGFRSKDAVLTLSSLSKDKVPKIRRTAIDAIFASGADRSRLSSWWDPGAAVPAKAVDPGKVLRLPFGDCRRRLADMGIAIPKDKEGKLVGDPGRSFEEQPPVPEASQSLHWWFGKETDPGLKLIAAIESFRLGDLSVGEFLVGCLRPLPAGTPQSDAYQATRARALRALQDSTSRTWDKWEEWDAWWKSIAPPKPEPAPGNGSPTGANPPGGDVRAPR